MPEERTQWNVDLSFSKLVKIPQKLKNMGSAAAGEREWWAVVAEVLAECVPVTALLVFVSA